MSKLQENKRTAEEAERLIDMMKTEIHQLRSIVERYYIKNGAEIYGEPIKLRDEISYSVGFSGMKLMVSRIDHDTIGVKSNYQRIIEKLNQLGL